MCVLPSSQSAAFRQRNTASNPSVTVRDRSTGHHGYASSRAFRPGGLPPASKCIVRSNPNPTDSLPSAALGTAELAGLAAARLWRSSSRVRTTSIELCGGCPRSCRLHHSSASSSDQFRVTRSSIAAKSRAVCGRLVRLFSKQAKFACSSSAEIGFPNRCDGAFGIAVRYYRHSSLSVRA